MAGKRTQGRAPTVPDLAAALNTLQEYLNNQRQDIVPEGFYTSREYTAQTELSEDRVRHLLLKGIRAGKVEVRKFIKGRNKVPHYRFKDK